MVFDREKGNQISVGVSIERVLMSWAAKAKEA
jgi:hypothetical protein